MINESYDNLTWTAYNDTGPPFVRLLTVGVYGVLVSSLTVFGNLMVIVAVLRERNLRSATNMYVFSLAVADLIMGLLVMPFSVVNDTVDWPFSIDACDTWRATDVFLSTASIMHLCVIAIERYSAVTNPIGHYVSRTKLTISIISVWLLSLLISYPAIIWWRATRDFVPSGVCPFTEDTTYLIASSMISFYLPSGVIIFVYYKILRTAQALSVGLRSGQLEIRLPHSLKRGAGSNSSAPPSERVTMRVHTGCRQAESRASSWIKDEASNGYGNTPSVSPYIWRRSAPPQNPSAAYKTPIAFTIPVTNTLPNSCRSSTTVNTAKQTTLSTLSAPTLNNLTTSSETLRLALQRTDSSIRMAVLSRSSDDECRNGAARLANTSSDAFADGSASIASKNGDCSASQTLRLSVCTSIHTDSIRMSSQRREQQRQIQHEQKAVKTIALIICLFIVCWTPFFFCNLLAAIWPSSILAPDVIFVVVSWLGYTNSCMNFIIYSYSLTDFRIAFKKLCGCKRKTPRSGYIPARWQLADTHVRKQQTDYPSNLHSTVIAEQL